MIDEIKVKTIKWFTESKCDVEQTVTLNSFNIKKEKWNKPLKIDYNFENYHGCTLSVYSEVFRIYFVDMLFEPEAFFIRNLIPEPYLKIITEAYEKRNEIEFNFLQIFAKQGNFTMEKTSRENERKKVIFLTTHIILFQYVHSSMEFFQEDYTLIATPAQAYNSYEKLMLPFDFTTWILLVVTFIISFATIFIANQASKKYQQIVFGLKVQTPSLNVAGTFFGIAQHKLPSNNFARIILILFVYFCLIFRTAYQGVFFIKVQQRFLKIQ